MKAFALTSLSAAFAMTVIAGCGHAPLAQVPARLAPPPGESLAMVVKATGVQVYECRAAQDGSHQWAFVAPDAQLFDERGRPLGKHYAGPHWEAPDGSRVVGAVRERADAPTAGAIPWLLLSSRNAGGTGAFSRVTHIQRVNTAGGIAPSTPCARGNAGQAARVPYTADYYFFAAAR